MEKQFPEFRLSSVNIDILLLGEVHAYSKSRDLRGEPVLRGYKVASKVVKDRIALANILCCTVDAFSFDTSDSTYFSKLDASITNMTCHLQKFENKEGLGCDRSVLLCTLGNLFYQKVRLLLQSMRQKSENEVLEQEKWNSKQIMPVIKTGEQDDLDMTEVTMVGSSLKVGQKSDLLVPLENAMKYWYFAEETLIPHVVLSPTLSFVKGMGYLMRLYCYKQLEIDCWNLLYRMALKLESKKYQVVAVAELLYSSENVSSSMISEVEILFESKQFNRKCYYYHLYRVNLARNFLLCQKIEECRGAFEKIDQQAVLPHFLVKVQFKMLSTLLEMEHPMNGCSNEAPLIPILKLFENLLYLVKNKQWETFNEATVIQFLMIDVATLLGTIYSDLKCVRYARCYVKADLNLVQKLALPARVCELMALRCWIDLLTWNVTESDCNAQQLESMLELGALKLCLSPARTNCRGSPKLTSRVKCVPHFLNRKECSCHNCTDANYPSLVLNAIIVRILILLGNGDCQETQHVINIGFSVLEILLQKRTSCNALWSPFTQSVARFYYVVATANFQWKKFKAVSQYGTLAYDMLQTEPIKNKGLLINTRLLLLNLAWVQNYSKPVRLMPVSQRFSKGESNECPVTPEAQKYSNEKPWESTVPKNGKIVEHGFTTHKQVYNRKYFNFDSVEAVGGLDIPDCVPLAPGTPEPSDTDKKVYLGGKTKTKNKPSIPRIICTPENEEMGELGVVSHGKYFNRKRLNIGHTDDSDTVTLKHPERVLPPNELGSIGVTPSTKGNKNIPPTRVQSARKVQTDKKSKLPMGNLFNNGGMPSMSKMISTTPAVKVFYDPEGLERSCTATSKKVAGTAKKTSRLAVLSKAVQDDRLSTPTVSRAKRPIKGKLTFDEDSGDELELVTAPFRKVLNSKPKGKMDPPEGPSVSKKLIHDDTTVVDKSLVDDAESSKVTLPVEEESPDVVDSSIVETTPPNRSARKCIALTPLSIEDKMKKLSLSTKTTRKPKPTTKKGNQNPIEGSSRTVRSTSRLKPKS